LWEYVIAGFNGGSFDFGVLINLLDYLPASLALAWSYEKSGSVWSPILLHALINVLSITAVLG
jgi:membrane protease YdiL (CAAX protease family)